MRFLRLPLLALLLLTLTAPAANAAATVEQHTTVKFGGMIGRMATMFGGKTAREGVDSTTVVKGDRRISRTGDAAEIVDLGEEKIYTINDRNKTYSVTTFAELRKKFEDASVESASDDDDEEPSGESEGPEYVMDVDVKETGATDTINGFAARQVVVTVTSHQKGKTVEEAGGGVLTADLWLGPKLAAVDEVSAFERKYLQALWGDSIDMHSFAGLVAMAPGFADAMKKFQQKSDALDGTPVRSIVTYEAVAGPADARDDDEESGSTLDPAAGAARMIGGMLARRARKSEPEEGGAKRSTLFTSTTELRKASTTADEAQLAIPAGYRQK